VLACYWLWLRVNIRANIVADWVRPQNILSSLGFQYMALRCFAASFSPELKARVLVTFKFGCVTLVNPRLFWKPIVP